MKNLLFIVASDPRSSAKPAEAVRVAAGVAAWKQAAFTLCFCGEAACALGDDAESLIDGELFTRCLPILREAGARLLLPDADSLAREVFAADSVSTW